MVKVAVNEALRDLRVSRGSPPPSRRSTQTRCRRSMSRVCRWRRSPNNAVFRPATRGCACSARGKHSRSASWNPVRCARTTGAWTARAGDDSTGKKAV